MIVVNASGIEACTEECQEFQGFPEPTADLWVLCEAHDQWWRAIDVDQNFYWTQVASVPRSIGIASSAPPASN